MGLFSKSKKEETTSCCCGGCTPEAMAQAETEKTSAGIKRGEIRKQAKSLKSSRLWTAGKQVTTE